MAPILFPEKLSDTLDRLSSLAKGDIRDLASKDKRELLIKQSEILDGLRRLLIKSKRDFASVSPIQTLFRLRKAL